MKAYDFATHDLSFREAIKKWTHSYEVRSELYSEEHKDLVASFSTTMRISGGIQVLNTSSEFKQHDYLSLEQIEMVTGWLRDCTLAARWRLTTFTTLVEAHP